jgi:hypothetical protein
MWQCSYNINETLISQEIHLLGYALRILVAAIVVVLISEVARFKPRAGALMLSLPLSSLVAFVLIWMNNKDVQMVSSLAREVLLMIPLSLVFFLPFGWMERFQIDFWTAMVLGVGASALMLLLWFLLAPGRL